jgi:hypothetical protein
VSDELDESVDPKEPQEPETAGADAPARQAKPEDDVQVVQGPEPDRNATRSGWLVAYLAAFVLVVAATVAMGFGGLSLLRTGSTIEGSTTLFWVSIVLAVVSIVLAGVALALSRRRH